MDTSELKAASARYPKPPDLTPAYGTAGFRALADLLPSTVFRCGVLMVARSLKGGGNTGLVVTASHNPEADNGVKLVDPSGCMLEQAWESHADRLAAADTDEVVCAAVQELFRTEDIPYGTGVVMVAHDTRPSAAGLAAAAVAGVIALGGVAIPCGLLTTPQLHWMVRQANASAKHDEGAYFGALADGFATLVGRSPAPVQAVVVDCANGVGGAKLRALAERLGPQRLPLDVRNAGGAACSGGGLNDRCGAEHVQKERAVPIGCADIGVGGRCASLDGDADRIVFWTLADGGGMTLFDGDRIAALAALLVRDLLAALPADEHTPTVGVVQTAYANGASTAYLAGLGLAVVCTLTGVKHLHAAAEAFDAGIYFEANGHGTVLFGQRLVQRLHELPDDCEAARDLLALESMVNQAVGDALSGLLLVEAVLRQRGWGLAEWGALYTDLPSRQLKVRVRDRSVVRTTDAETRTVAPDGLQQAIDAAVQAAPGGRAFVRPSGTEDVVRVYAEADTQPAADALAAEVMRAVHDLAGRTGARP
ncbi:hypothetical protein WJX81_006690 [Elliptochloris bilobata]|uniref:Phosphoacetylglucosamine mutase n=1 Tax=Elliptochloris bilobata TaxID=381761 RepID=A0AAW1S2H1_9CHLO